MNLPTLGEPKVKAAMVLIHHLFQLVQYEQYQYSPIIAFRLVHLTLKHGLSSTSMFAVHKAYLLEAEILSVEGRIDNALCKYDQGVLLHCTFC